MDQIMIRTKLPLLYFLLTTMVVFAVVIMIPPHWSVGWTSDSIHYYLAGRAFVSGHGLAVFNYSLLHPAYEPLTTWPPFYPLLLASGLSPLMIQAILLTMIGGLIFLIFLRAASIPPLLALVFTLIITLSWPLLMDATYVWSEVFCLFWVILAFFVLVGYSPDTGKWYVGRWLLAVLAVTAAVYTRYAAIAFLPGFFFGLLIAPWPRRLRITLGLATPFIIGLLLLPLLLRNFYSTGYFSGMDRLASHMSISTMVSREIVYLGWVFGDQIWQRAVYIICLSALVGSVFLLMRDRKKFMTMVRSSIHNERWLVQLSLLLFVSYVIIMVLLRDWKTFSLTVRMLSPAVPWMLMTLCAGGVLIWRTVPIKTQAAVYVIPIVGLLVLAVISTTQMSFRAGRNWREMDVPRWPATTLATYVNLAPLYPKPSFKGIILASRPMLREFQTGALFRRIPPRPWTQAMLRRILFQVHGILLNDQQSLSFLRASAHVLATQYAHVSDVHVDGKNIVLWRGILNDRTVKPRR